jgi:hypothetical protein
MTLDDLKILFATKKLRVLNSDIIYSFKDDNMLKNNMSIAKFELYEIDNKFFLKTTPFIYDSEDLAIEFKNQDPVFINLSTKLGRRFFTTLEEI